jgi:hypothetical protein
MIAEIKEFISISNDLLNLLQVSKDLLPEGVDKDEITAKLEQAKRQLATAEASTAKELGFHLCSCSFPPQIMLFKVDMNADVCPACGYKISRSYNTPTIATTGRRTDLSGY